MNNTAIIYSYHTQKSKKVSEKIIDEFGKSLIDVVNAEEISKEILEKYDNFILSAPTWFDGELPNYWDEFVPELEEMDLKGKTFAVFGLGDQKGYPENFCDAIGILAHIIEDCGGKLAGNVSKDGYKYESSKAERNGEFIGLPLDQENQARLTNERVKNWVVKLKEEFK